MKKNRIATHILGLICTTSHYIPSLILGSVDSQKKSKRKEINKAKYSVIFFKKKYSELIILITYILCCSTGLEMVVL